jgi:WD40 repeat protein
MTLPLVKLSILILAVLLSLKSVVVAGIAEPYLGEVAAILQWQDTRVQSSELSPLGSYVAAIFGDFDSVGRYEGSTLHIWDILSLQADTSIQYPQPSVHLDVEDSPSGIDISFSPDEQYLAILTSTDIQVLIPPDLSIYKSLPGSGVLSASGRIEWSFDGQLIAAEFRDELVVWDIANDETYHFDLDERSPFVSRVQNGWLLDYFPNGSQIGFIYCDWYLVTCNEYEFPSALSAVQTPDGEIIYAVRRETPNSVNREVGVWRLQSDDTYSFSESWLTRERLVCPVGFSPNSEYIVSACGREVSVVESSTFTSVNILPHFNHVVWADDQYFLAGPIPVGILALYLVGQEQPISQLNIVDAAGEQTEAWYVRSVTPDRRWVLIDFDKAIIVLSIEGWAS